MKKSRDRYRSSRTELGKKQQISQALPRKKAKEVEAENVRFFLHALNQMSLALHALGYATEGAALVKVKVDLDNRLFHPSSNLMEIAGLLH